MQQQRSRGSALPLLVLGVLMAAGAILLLGRLGGAAVDRASARTAADAAALAGAAEGRSAAAAVASANGARLVAYRERGLDTDVEVSFGKARAQARARRQVGGMGPGPGAMAPALNAVWARVSQLVGQAVAVQKVLASSSGQPGMALSVTPEAVPRLLAVAAQAGLCRPRPDAEPTLFEVCR